MKLIILLSVDRMNKLIGAKPGFRLLSFKGLFQWFCMFNIIEKHLCFRQLVVFFNHRGDPITHP